MNKQEFKQRYNLTEAQYTGKKEFSGYLYLRSVTTLPDGFNPTVGGYLDLGSVTTLPDGFNPTVGGYLDLRSVTTLPDGFNPTVGGDLDLGSVTTLPDGFNPTVGGDLDLGSVTTLPDGFNPTVGGDLDLRSDLKAKAKCTKLTTPIIKKPIVWPNDKYIKADGVFTEIIHQKGNVYQVRKINQQKVIYLVTDGNNKWAHGDTLKDARENLLYKIGNRDTSKFKGLSLTHLLSFSEGIEAYRTITGACSFGTQDFVKSNNVEKKSYTIADIITLTVGRFGHNQFKDFFKP